ncbi:Hypothetical predicted protein [Lecanosticta acicola]|uniref:Uncharacterized protein n=1 Tax=Lecanosticta acicola TaxID=111012 RepID=A0AAI8Z201_9PEZI|nr:Hypothetical predicted protein [Lecanosticta acicola]
MFPEAHRRKHKFKTPRRSPPLPDDELTFAQFGPTLDREGNEAPPLKRPRPPSSSRVPSITISEYLGNPSSPAHWSSTTTSASGSSYSNSQSSLPKHQRPRRFYNPGNDRERATATPSQKHDPPTPYQHFERIASLKAQSRPKPEKSRLPFPSEALLSQDEKLDEFIRNSSRLHQVLHGRVEALERLVQVLLEGYRELSGHLRKLDGRVKELEDGEEAWEDAREEREQEKEGNEQERAVGDLQSMTTKPRKGGVQEGASSAGQNSEKESSGWSKSSPWEQAMRRGRIPNLEELYKHWSEDEYEKRRLRNLAARRKNAEEMEKENEIRGRSGRNVEGKRAVRPDA